ncbi:nucleotidyltransferase family protein [Pseudomaricurvus alkylphenolicus]|uniref:nucleotidyltransferase family protein n=1 Tax=Pseudomaricurvus alkylphenolicus TaxID=1306991 RepID=UPI00141FCE6C|nr:nucleotidyltransferase family protein [Pseudomaricurvus alkylphenolicus]
MQINTHKLSPEQSLLLAASSPAANDLLTSQLLAYADTVDWTVLVQSALDHGVTGLLCHNLIGSASDCVPGDILEASRTHLEQQQAGNEALFVQLVSILEHLSNAGIPAVPFKGPTLALNAYGALNLRSFRDLDFLILQAQTQPCLDQLKKLGYTHDWELTPRQWKSFLQYAGEEILFGPGLPIEPHWHFAPRTVAYDLDYSAIWSRVKPVTISGKELLSLTPEDELMAVCLHGSKERWTKLKWVADVAAYVHSHPDLDWSILRQRAQAQGVARATLLGLGLAHRLLSASLPQHAQRWLNNDREAQRLTDQITTRYFEGDEAERSIYDFNHLHWRMRERARDRWRYLLRTLLQPRVQHFNSIAIPDALFVLYIPYKLLHDYLALPLWQWLKALKHRQSGTEEIDATR